MAQAQQQLQDPLAVLDRFNQLAGETQSAIFSGLGVNDLKHCRLVCTTWNEQVSSERLLYKNVVLSYRHERSSNSFWKNLMRAFRLYWKRLNFTVPTFRFYDRVSSSIFLWFTKHNMRNVTSVEFRDCSLYVHQLLLLFRKLPNVTSLKLFGPNSMLNCNENSTPNDRDFMKPYYMEESMENFQKLKKCDIELFLQTQSIIFLELLMLKCHQMEELRFVFPVNHGWQHTQVFTRLGDYLKSLGGTLRALHIEIKEEVGLEAQPGIAQPPDVQNGLGSLDKLLETMHLRQWNNFRLDNLEELYLDFQLTNSDLPRIETALIPFLATLQSINKFNLKKLSVRNGEEQDVFDIVPQNCNLAKIDSIQRMDQNALGNNNAVVLPPVPDALTWSRMEITTGNLNLKMSEVACDVEFTRTMVLDRLERLTKLNVYQLRVPQQQQLQVTDDFLQRIIERATNLVELSLEYCDFENLSDFGITGISAEAGLRMRTSGNYNIQDGDQTGVSLSTLTRLQIFRMGIGLTDSVTDVTARLAFIGNPKMRILSLSMPEFSDDGITALREIFAANQIIKINIDIGLPAEQN